MSSGSSWNVDGSGFVTILPSSAHTAPLGHVNSWADASYVTAQSL